MTNIYNNYEKKNLFKISKEIICPECLEICLLNIKDFKINLFHCKNGHKIENIGLKEFNNMQIINESKIKCFNCNNNKSTTYNNEFFICLTCNKYLCPLCKSNHDKTHKIIEFDKKNYICNIHYDSYISYCKECKTNLCMLYEKKHNKKHYIENYKAIIQDEKDIKEELNQFKEKIEKMKEKIKSIIGMTDKVIKNMEIYYEINYKILNNYKIENKNYEHLKNIFEIKNNINIKDIDNIIKEDNIKNQIMNILIIYNKMIPKQSVITRNPPKECLIYENLINLNKKFIQLEKEIKEKSNNMNDKIKKMKNKLLDVPKKKTIFSNCVVYENKSSGLASIEFNDGGKYEGEFLNDEKNGIGIDYK